LTHAATLQGGDSVTEPNLFQLSGSHVHVTYATSGIDGKPSLAYHDAMRALQFRGDELEVTGTLLGTIVSVTIVRTVDFGSTSFSILVPRVNIDQGTPAPVHTRGITTIHRFSLVPALDRGQLDTYTVTSLHGSAQVVDF
jgi:hypothetical protein